MNSAGIDFFGDHRNSLFWSSADDQQPAVQLCVQMPQAVAQELQAAGTRRCFEAGIEDKACEHFTVLVGCRCQGRQVAQPQVATEPQ